jgi:hypothetical protein
MGASTSKYDSSWRPPAPSGVPIDGCRGMVSLRRQFIDRHKQASDTQRMVTVADHQRQIPSNARSVGLSECGVDRVPVDGVLAHLRHSNAFLRMAIRTRARGRAIRQQTGIRTREAALPCIASGSARRDHHIEIDAEEVRV